MPLSSLKKDLALAALLIFPNSFCQSAASLSPGGAGSDPILFSTLRRFGAGASCSSALDGVSGAAVAGATGAGTSAEHCDAVKVLGLGEESGVPGAPPPSFGNAQLAAATPLRPSEPSFIIREIDWLKATLRTRLPRKHRSQAMSIT